MTGDLLGDALYKSKMAGWKIPELNGGLTGKSLIILNVFFGYKKVEQGQPWATVEVPS